MARGNVGDVTFEYDSRLLASAEVQLAVPAAEESGSFAVKLIPARDLKRADAPACANAAPDDERPCTLADQPGISFALLERPFATYSRALQASDLGAALHPRTVDGVEGVSVDAGVEGGLQVEYTLVPVESRALLIKRQADGETEEEHAALAAVMASLDLPG